MRLALVRAIATISFTTSHRQNIQTPTTVPLWRSLSTTHAPPIRKMALCADGTRHHSCVPQLIRWWLRGAVYLNRGECKWRRCFWRWLVWGDFCFNLLSCKRRRWRDWSRNANRPIFCRWVPLDSASILKEKYTSFSFARWKRNCCRRHRSRRSWR